MNRRDFLRTSALATLAGGISLANGCGGAGGSTTDGKFDGIDFARTTAAKDGRAASVHGSLHDISRAEEAARFCQGGPPLLPYPGTISVSSPPAVLTYPSADEAARITEWNEPAMIACVQAVQARYPAEVADPLFFSRLSFDTYAQASGRAFGTGRIGPVTIPEFLLFSYRPQDWAAAFMTKHDSETAVQTYYGTDCDSDRGNAFKHAYWNIRLCIAFDEELAEKATSAHEDFPDNHADTKAMDLHNNAIGRKVYREHIKGNPSAETYAGAAEKLFEYIATYPTALVAYPDIPDIPNLVCLQPSCSDDNPVVPGEILVSETDDAGRRGIAGFYREGHPQYWKRKSIGYGGSMLMTMTNGASRDNAAWWTPNLPVTGQYEVQAFVPANYADTHHAEYFVAHRNGLASVAINQSVYFNQWVSLGTYLFDAGTVSEVMLNDVTGEPFNTRMIGFDAVRFVKK